jgi:hypothetical protein
MSQCFFISWQPCHDKKTAAMQRSVSTLQSVFVVTMEMVGQLERALPVWLKHNKQPSEHGKSYVSYLHWNNGLFD